MNKSGRRAVYLLLFGAVALICVVGLGVQQTAKREARALRSEGEDRQSKIIAHRGGALCAPENTLAALEQAAAVGADLAEFDLRMTKDGVIVALHDETLERTAGLDRPVWELDSQDLQNLEVGSWFSADFAGEPIPTLDQLLEAARGRIKLMLELKQPRAGQPLLEQVVAQIQAKGMEEACIVASSDVELLSRSKELLPELETVYIGETAGPELWELPYVDGYSIALPALTLQDVQRSHQAGRELYAWTVNERWEVERALSLEVDGLVTDDPAMVQEQLDGREVKTKH